MAGGDRRGSRKKRGPFRHDNKKYHYQKETGTSLLYRCASIRNGVCPGRCLKNKKSGEVTVTRPHTCGHSVETAKDEAFERLRELINASAGQPNVKAIKIVRQLLKELSPETRLLMPTEESLVYRVRRWAKLKGIVLTRPGPEDFIVEDPSESEPWTEVSPEHCVSAAEKNTASSDKAEFREEPTPGTSADASRNQGGSGLVFLKGCVQDRNNALIENEIFVFAEDLDSGQELYRCRKARIGCPVSAIIHRAQKNYKLSGDTHMHEEKPRKPKANNGLKGWMSRLKFVDDDGNELAPPVPVRDEKETLSADIDMAPGIFDDGDDCHDDFNYDTEAPISAVVDDHVTPVKPNNSQSKRIQNPVKSGERCFVCGDELIVSEVLSSNSETLRKACCYLNVRSEKEWFPKSSLDSQFYSFCESCSNEIAKIHGLYKKVEEIQSMIFKKLENVEKRIADSEIVDNWMAETPILSVKRFEGFRKQVLINYRNKLRLRREIRVGRKMGHNFTEVRPTSSAHMFASDPTEAPMEVPGEVPVGNDSENTLEENKSRTKRRRGRPKKNRDDLESKPIPTFTTQSSTPSKDDFMVHDYDDNDAADAMSVHSEQECKFDPNAVQVNPNEAIDFGDPSGVNRNDVADFSDTASQGNNDKDDPDYDGGGDLSDAGSASNDDKDDPDYELDERSGHVGKKPAGKKTETKSVEQNNCRKGSPPPSSGKSQWFPSAITKKQDQCRQGSSIPTSDDKTFPDAIMRKDGRIFMQGTEIIKNPPGVYKRYPYSISFTCGTCGKIVPSFYRIRLHICGHHLGLYKCPICNKQVTERGLISKHIKLAHSKVDPNPCHVCGRPLKGDRSGYNRHIWTHLSEDEKKDSQYKSYGPAETDGSKPKSTRQTFMCSYCSKTFSVPSALKRHELEHTGEITYQCQMCGNLYKNGKSLYQHVSRCEQKQKGISLPKGRLSCPKCPARFTYRSTKSKHMRKFHPKDTLHYPFSCQKCHRGFSNKTALGNHKRHCGGGQTKRMKFEQEPAAHSSTTLMTMTADENASKYNPGNASESPSASSSHETPGLSHFMNRNDNDLIQSSSHATSAPMFNYMFEHASHQEPPR